MNSPQDQSELGSCLDFLFVASITVTLFQLFFSENLLDVIAEVIMTAWLIDMVPNVVLFVKRMERQ